MCPGNKLGLKGAKCFAKVFDVSFAVDMAHKVEEANEFLKRLERNEDIPLLFA
jgi:iron only hydrogenase large subunit-like protein